MTFLARAVASGVLLAFASVSPLAQAAASLEQLTVPQEQLAAAGCRLSPSQSIRTSDNRVRSGLWTGLPITTNPWIGTEPAVAATIRERLGDSPSPPDGPPQSPSELARFRLRLAEDVEQAYAAIYLDEAFNLVVVHALTWKAPARHEMRWRSGAGSGLRFSFGNTIVAMSGEGSCWEPVSEHLAAWKNPRIF